MSLTLVGPAEPSADGHIRNLFRCVCGTEKVIITSRVRNGYTKSCGCIRASIATHGMKNTPTYSSWSSAKDRATNPKSKDWQRYGAVGIGMCERWLKFKNFLADLGVKPPGCSIDRIDNTKGYVVGNVRWADAFTQANNRKTTVMVSMAGEVMPLADAARRIGISHGALHLRLKRKTIQEVSYV